MRLFVGLGNPGREHAGQRHNIGFMVVDAIAARHRATPFRAKFNGQLGEATIGAERVLLLKPETYMNDSGRSVGAAARFHKLALADITIFHDELDLSAGLVRVKTGGGNAGHNGLRSVTGDLGNDYRRVRLGIGHPGMKERVLGYVLGNFDRDEVPWLTTLCDAIATDAAELAEGRDAQFQNRVHAAMAAVLPAAATR